MKRENSAARLAGLLIAALLILTGMGWAGEQGLVNKRAPLFTRPGLQGGTVKLGAYKGKVVVLNFWATWCEPCLKEMPVFSEWQRKYGAEGLQVVGVSMDDNPAGPRRLVERLKLNYPAAMGDAKVGNLYGGVYGLPFTLLIDRRGMVRAEFSGETEMTAMEEQLRALLKAQ